MAASFGERATLTQHTMMLDMLAPGNPGREISAGFMLGVDGIIKELTRPSDNGRPRSNNGDTYTTGFGDQLRRITIRQPSKSRYEVCQVSDDVEVVIGTNTDDTVFSKLEIARKGTMLKAEKGETPSVVPESTRITFSETDALLPALIFDQGRRGTSWIRFQDSELLFPNPQDHSGESEKMPLTGPESLGYDAIEALKPGLIHKVTSTLLRAESAASRRLELVSEDSGLKLRPVQVRINSDPYFQGPWLRRVLTILTR